ncbi:hypothetical protein [Paenibacillus riograndensis]|uniref:Uncharacterized protein n=1 Tax=Paenibacillus riograndensis SBR5 TaxID=1073571 RepID=A0A0E3WG02_9BACL|nr:hypothetical protein [Paenibacillus riograndensis]CQR51498.1 hypothetical protein PRIO_0244 [Paenibacillus riograndensis SBR5]
MRAIDLGDLSQAADIKSACMFIAWKVDQNLYEGKDLGAELKELLINIVEFENTLSSGIVDDLKTRIKS